MSGRGGRHAALRRVQGLFAVVGVAEAAILPFLPIVLAERGLSPAQIGLVLSIAAAAGFLATPLWGYAADRWWDAERTLVASSLLAAVAVVPLAFADGVLALTLAVAAVTIARSPMPSLADAIALERLPGDARADYGRVRLWTSVGWAVAAVVWGVVLQTGTLELLPLIYALTAVSVAVWAHVVGGGRGEPVAAERASRREMVRGLAGFLVSLLLLFAAFSATFSFVAVRIHELGGGLAVIGIAAALQAASEVPVMRVTPHLSRTIGHRAIYVTGALVFAAAFAAWGFLADPLWLALVKLLAGVGFALAYVGSVVIVDDLVPASLRGTGQGLAKGVSFGLAPIVGSLAGGAIYDYAGPRALFLAAAGAAVVAGAAVWAVAGTTRARFPEPVAAGYEAQP